MAVPGVTRRHLQALRDAFALHAAAAPPEATAVGEVTDVDSDGAVEIAPAPEN